MNLLQCANARVLVISLLSIAVSIINIVYVTVSSWRSAKLDGLLEKSRRAQELEDDSKSEFQAD